MPQLAMSTKLLYFHKSALSWDRERMDGKIALTWCHGLPEHHLISLFYFIWLYFLHLNYIFVLLLCLLHSFFSGLHSSLLKWLFSWRLLITSNALKGFLVLILQLLHMSQNFDFILTNNSERLFDVTEITKLPSGWTKI